MEKYEKPDLGTDYSGIETIKKYVKEMQADYENSYNEDILGYVLWILDDYKRLKQGDGTNFSRITASPEALAKWVCEITDFCDRGCSHCPIQKECLYNADGAGSIENEQMLLEWLKRESDTE